MNSKKKKTISNLKKNYEYYILTQKNLLENFENKDTEYLLTQKHDTHMTLNSSRNIMQLQSMN